MGKPGAAVKRFFFWLFVILVFASGWLLGDRLGVPQPVRDAITAALGKGGDALGESGMQAKRYAEERLREAETFSFDDEMPPPPSDLKAEELASPGNTLALCPRMSVSNAPAAREGGVVAAPERVVVRGVALRLHTAPGACLSSGYGSRNGKIHKGIDLHHPDGVDVIAGAAGRVLEAAYRDDYGNYVLIDHGSGVYTRYAHLRGFAGGITAGAAVRDGQTLGRMGNSAGYSVPVHLHYEILTGDYDTPKKAFGLKPVDPFGV